MKYRCYSCGFKLGDGIPPVEALNMDQRAAIGETDGTGLRMSGMSGYSYCLFCLLFEEEYGTMDKAEPGPHYMFSDYGRVLYREDKDNYCDPVLANRLLMAHNVLTGNVVQKLPLPLADILIDQMDEVKATQLRLDKEYEAREIEAAKLHNRIRKEARHLYFLLREKVPYHLEKGIGNLWFALAMSKRMDEMDEQEQDDLYEALAWESQHWQYENDGTAPFARFELWTIGFMLDRFTRIYDEENS